MFVVVEKLSPADLLGLLKGRGQRDPEITTALIREVAHPLIHKTVDYYSSLRYQVTVGNHRKKFIVSGPYLCDPDPDPAFYAELVPIRIQGFNDHKFKKNTLGKNLPISRPP